MSRMIAGQVSHECGRKRYVEYRLKLLDQMAIPRPPADKITRMLDESAMTDYEVDAVLHGCIMRAFGV